MRPLTLILALCVTTIAAAIAADDPAPPPPAQVEHSDQAPAVPTPDEAAQIVLMIGDRQPVTLASGQWRALQPIVAQIGIIIDAMQWRELRARMAPPQTKEPSK